MTKKEVEKNRIIEVFLVILLAIISTYFANRLMLKLYFWRDDWHNFWGTSTNSFVYMDSCLWVYQRGLIAPLLYGLYKITNNYLIWQWMGLILKVVNVVLTFYFIKTITKSRQTSLYGMLFYAVYSGGLEDYSWVRQNGLVITLILLLFIFLQYFLEKGSKKQVLIYSFVSWVVLLLFFGQGIFFSRVFTMLMVYLFWIFAYQYIKFGFNYFKNIIKNNKTIVFVLSILIVCSLCYLILWAIDYKELSNSNFLRQVYIDRNIYLGSVGSLLSNPYYYTREWGALAGTLTPNVWFGGLSMVLLLCFMFLFLKTRNKTYALLTLSLLWVHFAYLVNWLFGGGGTKTAIGSSHRYLAVSAIGVVLLTSITLSKIPKKYAYVFFIGILFLGCLYTKRINEGDFWIRGQPVVGHFYSTVASGVADGKKARLILVEAPDKLQAPVVSWSLPWAYAYYKKLNYSDFPLFFSKVDDAISWICANEAEKIFLEKRLGITDFRKSQPLVIGEIYAWKLEPNGNLYNQTDSFRYRISECFEKHEEK